MRRLFLSLFFFVPVFAFAQTKSAIDSIETRLPSLAGVDRSRALYELVYYYLRVDTQRARSYYLETKKYDESEDPQVLAYAYMARGLYYNRTGLLDSAVTMLQLANDKAIAANNDHALVRIYLATAHTNITSGKPEKGLDYLFKGLQIVARHPDTEMEMKLRTNIPWAYLELKQYRNCVRYGLENVRLLEGGPYEWILLYSYNNVAVSYGALGMIDSAKYFIEKGMSAARKSNDNQSLANAYFILGTIYSNAGQYKLAIEQYLKARPFREKVGNPFFLVSDLYTMSDLYFKSGDFKKGVTAGNEALSIAEEYKLTLKFEGTYLSLAKNYEGLGDYRNASKFYRLYAIAKDTVYKNASTQAIAEMQTKYETEKKEKQLAIQKAELLEQATEIQQGRMVAAALIVALGFLTIIFLLLRSRWRKKQQILQKEKELYIREAQIQASIQSQEIERKRFAQDLHDGMGQLISALRLALHSIDKEASMEERVEVLARGEKILNEMHHEIRGIAFNLMPQTLVQHGLVPALKEMSDRVNGSGKIVIRVSSFDLPKRLTELEEISLYRVIQEWVNNVMKYAQASLIQIQLIGHEGEINVTIEDDGKGFDTSVLHNSSGNGWKNIRSRLNLVKGSVEIDSRPGMTGTTMIIRIANLQQTAQPDVETIKLRPANAGTVAPNTH
ncbi:MAG TPA: sensor histidine kinase [Chryseosolibacter sp.]|nr:sensor histidine kinase [Chryseosolibacter sp.]